VRAMGGVTVQISHPGTDAGIVCTVRPLPSLPFPQNNGHADLTCSPRSRCLANRRSPAQRHFTPSCAETWCVYVMPLRT